MATVRASRGEIWWAKFPYSDDPEQGKTRPVLVLGLSPSGPNQDSVVLVAPITSYGGGASARTGDVAILNWRGLGLEKASWVRARRVWGANPSILQGDKPMAHVDAQVMSTVFQEIASLL